MVTKLETHLQLLRLRVRPTGAQGLSEVSCLTGELLPPVLRGPAALRIQARPPEFITVGYRPFIY